MAADIFKCVICNSSDCEENLTKLTKKGCDSLKSSGEARGKILNLIIVVNPLFMAIAEKTTLVSIKSLSLKSNNNQQLQQQIVIVIGQENL